MATLEQKTEFYARLWSLSKTLRIIQYAFGKPMPILSILSNGPYRKFVTLAVDKDIIDDVKSKIDKVKKTDEKGVEIDPGQATLTACKLVMTNYEKILFLSKSKTSELLIVDDGNQIDGNLISSCDHIMISFAKISPRDIVKLDLIFKPFILFCLSIIESLISLVSLVKSFDKKEYDRLMKKHVDLIAKFELTTDYARLFEPSFSLVNLSPFLPTLPKELINIIIPFTQLTCFNTSDLVKILIK
jgi:hypothetical protein